MKKINFRKIQRGYKITGFLRVRYHNDVDKRDKCMKGFTKTYTF